LVSTFPAPTVIPCNYDHIYTYQQSYEAYRRFADFALKEASQIETAIN
jgi:hypothetical protein